MNNDEMDYEVIGASTCGEYVLVEFADDFGELYNCSKVGEDVCNSIGGYHSIEALEKLKGFSFILHQVAA